MTVTGDNFGLIYFSSACGIGYKGSKCHAHTSTPIARSQAEQHNGQQKRNYTHRLKKGNRACTGVTREDVHTICISDSLSPRRVQLGPASKAVPRSSREAATGKQTSERGQNPITGPPVPRLGLTAVEARNKEGAGYRLEQCFWSGL